MSLAANPRALIVESDAALAELIAEWLAGRGVEAATDPAAAGVDLIVADVPDLRHGGTLSLARLSAAHPGTPILALSSSFLASVDAHGAVAQWLGVAGVLPKPLTREALLGAVGRILGFGAPA